MISHFIENIATNCGGSTSDFLKLVCTEGSSTNFSVQIFEAGDVIIQSGDNCHVVYMVSYAKTEVNEKGQILHWYGIKEIKEDYFGITTEFNETEAHSYIIVGKIDSARLNAYINLKKQSN